MKSRSELSEELSERVRDVVNEYRGLLSNESVALIFAEHGWSMLDCMIWRPHSPRAAHEHFMCAIACLRDGRVIPVDGFAFLFPDAGEGFETEIEAQEGEALRN
jgi:hypothetical protein